MIPSSAIPRPSVRTTDAIWLDVNSGLGLNSKPDLLPDGSAINNSLFNLFSCPVGARGPIFQPEYGSILHRLLHEPLDFYTANKMRAYLIQVIQRWEPRIVLDIANTRIDLDYSLPGYFATIRYSILATNTVGEGIFQFNTEG